VTRINRIALCIAVVGVATIAAYAQDADKAAPPPAPAAAPAPAPAPAQAATPSAPMRESIKIIFDDKAKNDGELVFTFTPEGGAAKSIRVTIAAKMNHKDVARDVTKELKVALGDAYDVDNYDSDKIKIDGKKNAKFSLTVSSMTAHGLSVRLN
jgi:hypothetical protein